MNAGLLVVLIALTPAVAFSADPSGPPPASPKTARPLSITSASGEHSLELGLVSRFRNEWWNANADHTSSFWALRSRASARYRFRSLFSAFAEFQDTRIYGLDSRSSGAGGLYYRWAGFRHTAINDAIRQLWAELEPTESLAIRVGRQDIKLGTEVMYPEPAWRYLKKARGSQRLVGTVGWTHAERSNDGAVATWDRAGYRVYGFAAKPTTGVFDLPAAYRSQHDILYGGATLTAKRDTWLPGTEVRLFGLVYNDSRSRRHGGLSDTRSLDVRTLGASVIGIRPAGPGEVDLLLWGAYQWGSWPLATNSTLSHSAWAAIGEAGYRFTHLPAKPWLRLGINVASGDGDPNDGSHNTFFNMLPTNHLYYGFADQLAFQNLVDSFVQLRLAPLQRTRVDVFLHRFVLFTGKDARYAGTGAFNRRVFGFVTNPSNGRRSVGTELDLIVSHDLTGRIQLQAGLAYLWGSSVLKAQFPADENVAFSYVQVTVRYP